MIIGEDCCLDDNRNGICDNQEKKENEQESRHTEKETEEIVREEEEKSDKVQTKELPDRSFTMQELEEAIEIIEDRASIFQEVEEETPILKELKEENQKLIVSNRNRNTKTWALQIIDEKERQLKNSEDFIEFVDSPEWQMWRFYTNESNWKLLYRSLTQDELEESVYNYEYRDYLKSGYIDIDTRQDRFTTKYGSIPQYRLETMWFDQFDNWEGNLEPGILIYKIPCTKDVVIYYRPRWKDNFGSTGYLGISKENVIKHWEEDINSKKEENREIIEKVMFFCGIRDNNFIETDAFSEYSNASKRVLDWQIYYAKLFNFTLDIDIEKEEMIDENKVSITGINFTFMHNDELDEGFYRSKGLTFEIYENQSGKISNYDELSKQTATGILPNKIFNYYAQTDRKEHPNYAFSGSNISLIIRTYIGKEDAPRDLKYYIGEARTIKIS